MQFNKIMRGNNRSANTEQSVFDILDAGFLCHISFQHEGQTMMIPTAYGRNEDCIFIHGSTKNFMMNQLLNGQTLCVGVTHLDGIVLARTLFDTSANYRSVVLFGTAELISDEKERMDALKIITDNIIQGRWEEVPVGSDNELKATMLIKIKIESASAKIRSGDPQGDENKTNPVWSGHIPLAMKALEPIHDPKFGENLPMSSSVKDYWNNNK